MRFSVNDENLANLKSLLNRLENCINSIKENL